MNDLQAILWILFISAVIGGFSTLIFCGYTICRDMWNEFWDDFEIDISDEDIYSQLR